MEKKKKNCEMAKISDPDNHQILFDNSTAQSQRVLQISWQNSYLT